MRDWVTAKGRGYRPGLLRRNADFRAVWTGEALSRFGTQITAVALPLVAVRTLNADPGQLGLLAALQFAPVLLITPLAGALADRRSRRTIMMVANLGRAITLAVVPILAVLDRLAMPHLYLVAAVTGGLTAAFDVVYLAYVPHLVRREDLIEANGRLQATYSTAQAAGPGVGGVLVQALTAPIAVLVDAISYLMAFVS
ncbi:MAG: MFS transporter, partial [Gammaproteobacteria bacterium]